jgi:hypothetical protein
MTVPKKNGDKPTHDELAGTPLSKEENGPTTRIAGARRVKSRAPALRDTRSAPSADDLAGTPVSAEGEEDATIRRRPQPPSDGR